MILLVLVAIQSFWGGGGELLPITLGFHQGRIDENIVYPSTSFQIQAQFYELHEASEERRYILRNSQLHLSWGTGKLLTFVVRAYSRMILSVSSMVRSSASPLRISASCTFIQADALLRSKSGLSIMNF